MIWGYRYFWKYPYVLYNTHKQIEHESVSPVQGETMPELNFGHIVNILTEGLIISWAYHGVSRGPSLVSILSPTVIRAILAVRIASWEGYTPQMNPVRMIIRLLENIQRNLLKISPVYPDFIYLNLCRIFVQQTVNRSNVSPCSGRHVSACFDSLQGAAVQEEQQPSLL